MNRNKLATLLLVAASAMWGSSFVASKFCINSGMMQFEIAFYRFAIATVLTGLLFHKQLRYITRNAVRTGFALGLLNVATFALEMCGLSLTTASKSSFLTATNIVMMPFLYALFCGVKPSRYSLAAAVLAMTGVGCLSLTEGFGSIQLGDILLLIDASTYCLSSICIVKMAGEDSRVQITFFQFLFGAVGLGILTLFQGSAGWPGIGAAGAVLYLALVPTITCYLIKNWAIQYLDPVRCTMILSTESIFCAILSVTLLGDELNLRMLLGMALIMAGVLVESFFSGRKTQRAAERVETA